MPRVADTDSGRAWVHNGKIIRYVGDVGLGRDNVRFDRVTMSVRLRRKARTGLYSDAVNGVFRPASPEQAARFRCARQSAKPTFERSRSATSSWSPAECSPGGTPSIRI